MSEKNCRDLAQQADIDGFLVGGASLKPACRSRSAGGSDAYADIAGSRRYHQCEGVKGPRNGDESRLCRPGYSNKFDRGGGYRCGEN